MNEFIKYILRKEHIAGYVLTEAIPDFYKSVQHKIKIILLYVVDVFYQYHRMLYF